MGIVDFLRARLDEEELMAAAASGDLRQRMPPRDIPGPGQDYDLSGPQEGDRWEWAHDVDPSDRPVALGPVLREHHERDPWPLIRYEGEDVPADRYLQPAKAHQPLRLRSANPYFRRAHHPGYQMTFHWPALETGGRGVALGVAAHIAHHDPARAVDSVAARRRIADAYEQALKDGDTARAATLEEVLHLLCEPYRDHPDHPADQRPRRRWGKRPEDPAAHRPDPAGRRRSFFGRRRT